jgi:catechol O-methyltransferase
MRKFTEIGGKKLPFFRWSAWRMALGMRHLTRHWQVGDGREEALAKYVFEHAPVGDLDAAIAAVDRFCYDRSLMMNVGDEKGALLDAAIRRAQPSHLMELGTYCGYSALRTIRAMPATAHLHCIEYSAENARIASRILEHAGVGDRATLVVGYLGDGRTPDVLQAEHGFGPGYLDFVFIDHDKAAYLPDICLIVERRWLGKGAVVVADNVRVPGAPRYRAYMQEQEGLRWHTVEHKTHVEYQSIIPDLVLESDYLGGEEAPGEQSA